MRLYGKTKLAVLVALVLPLLGALLAGGMLVSTAFGQEPPDPFTVPKGDAETLLKFIHKVKQLPPPMISKGKNGEVDLGKLLAIGGLQQQHRQKQSQAMLAAADKVLAMNPTEEQAARAIRYKLEAWRISQRNPAAQREELFEQFKEDRRPAIVRAFKADQFLDQIAGWKQDADEESRRALLEDLKAYFSEKNLLLDDAKLAITVGDALASSGDRETAVAACELMGSALGSSQEKPLAAASKKLLGNARRLNLVGGEMELAGSLLDGSKFDWAPYRGKVVLVDFWATWCGGCIAEMPEIVELYEKYRDQGFEVIGITLDFNREAPSDFVKERKIPWATVYDGDRAVSGHYGINAIPVKFVIGRDGKVLTTTARGEELARLLEELFNSGAQAD